MAMSMSHGNAVSGRPDSNSEPETTAASPNWSSRIAMLGGLAAAETYWLYAIFIAHVLTISVYLTDRSTNLRSVVGQIGDVGEAIHFNRVIASLLASAGLFVFVWFVVRGGSLAFSNTRIFADKQGSQQQPMVSNCRE
jgi:hypothetical protein